MKPLSRRLKSQESKKETIFFYFLRTGVDRKKLAMSDYEDSVSDTTSEGSREDSGFVDPFQQAPDAAVDPSQAPGKRRRKSAEAADGPADRADGRSDALTTGTPARKKRKREEPGTKSPVAESAVPLEANSHIGDERSDRSPGLGVGRGTEDVVVVMDEPVASATDPPERFQGDEHNDKDQQEGNSASAKVATVVPHGKAQPDGFNRALQLRSEMDDTAKIYQEVRLDPCRKGSRRWQRQ